MKQGKHSATKLIGNEGEAIALRFLVASGFDVLDTNVRSRSGEIDIVACKDDTIHFVEVKTRTGTFFGPPIDAVDKRKLSTLMELGEEYCAEHDLTDCAWQVDVIGVLFTSDNEPDISFYTNISE